MFMLGYILSTILFDQRYVSNSNFVVQTRYQVDLTLKQNYSGRFIVLDSLYSSSFLFHVCNRSSMQWFVLIIKSFMFPVLFLFVHFLILDHLNQSLFLRVF